MTGATLPLSHHHEQNSSGLNHPSLPKLGADLANWHVLGNPGVPEVGDRAAKLKRPDETGNLFMTHATWPSSIRLAPLKQTKKQTNKTNLTYEVSEVAALLAIYRIE